MGARLQTDTLPIGLFDQSIALDPNYALAYEAKGELYGRINILGAIPARETAAKAKVAITRVLQLNDSLAEAHAMLGTITARHEYNWVDAEKHIRRALELDPNSSFAHNELAQNVLAPQGRFEEALAENRRARELDPLSPVPAIGYPFLLGLQRQNDKAIAECRAVLSRNPSDTLTHLSLALALQQKGDPVEALAEFQKAGPMATSPQSQAFIGAALATAGRKPEAEAILRKLENLSKSMYVSPSSLAILYVGLGRNDQAFESLEKPGKCRNRALFSPKWHRRTTRFAPTRASPSSWQQSVSNSSFDHLRSPVAVNSPQDTLAGVCADASAPSTSGELKHGPGSRNPAVW